MNTRFALAMVSGLTASCLSTAWSFQLTATESLANYDRRLDSANGSPSVWAPAQAQAVANLKSRVPGVTVSRDRVLGTPQMITSTRGFLTGPGGAGLAVSEASLAAIPADDEQRIIKAFLNEHSALFGHDAGVLTSARVQRDYVTPHNGLRTTVWEQTLDGIPVFEGLLIGHVTQNGELVSLSSHFVPDPARAADAGTPNRGFLVGNPVISVARAIRLAAANVNIPVEESQIAVSGSPQGAELRQTATAAGLFGPAQAQLFWLPMNRDAMRLCWRVVLGDRSTLHHFLVLVDAETGDVLVRHGLTTDIQPATYNVYTNDSPSPFSPGHATPSSIQPSNVTRALVTLSALDTNASPAGWVPDGINPPTSGNNVEAFLWREANFDINGNPAPDVPLPRGGTNRVFNFPLDLNTDPSVYASAATVQMFYRANWYHDRLYQMGFTEAAGNFQVNNFGRGGFGNDNVVALVQGEAELGATDNAFFSTQPDGLNGYCVMFVWDGTPIERDGDLDSEVICHEMTHGLSNRLLGGGVGISQLQTEGMGEGWSDFFALSLLSQSTDNPNGNYAMGGYVTYFPLFGFTDNYYYGIRRYPYSTDMSKNPLTFKDIDPTKASAHLGVPRNPFFGGGGASEPHASGEVWCVTLHEMWANIVLKSGWVIGNELSMQLVVDGLKLAPANATFLQARDAIILADVIDTGGDNYLDIWLAFAKRGMGFSAICPPSDTTIGVTEAYDLPPDIGTPDGILEVKVTPPSGEAMFSGETNTILVRVSDSFPVTNATIAATITGGTNLAFRNDGVAPDQVANNSVSSASLKVPTNQPSITITLVVSAPGKDTSTNVVTYVIVPLPPNDYFTNATKVPVGGTNYFTSNKRATLETNEPIHANISSATASLWWNYTPAANTNVLVDTGSSGFRTVIAVYTNQTLATLQPVVSAVGTPTRPGTFVNFNAQAGRTYHIAIAGYDVKNVGTLSLTIAPGLQPDTNAPNVTITSPLNGQVVSTNRIFLTGTAVDPSPNPSGIKDINVRVIPVAGAASTTVLPPSLIGPLSTNWSTIVGLLPGINDVQVTVSDYAGNISAPVSIQVTYRVLDPVNDFFANAIVLTGTDGTNSVNTVNATKEGGEPNHAGNLGGKSAWWFYTPPANGILTLSTIFSSFDTVLATYTGPDVSHLTPIASNDDAYDGVPGGYSQIVQAVISNQTYRIAVDGYDGAGGLVFLTYSFTTGTVFHVTVNTTTGGLVAPTSADVQSNGTLIVTATPNANYQFDMWDGAVISLNNPLFLTVNGNMTLTGHFIPVGFTDDFESGDLRHINWTTNGAAVGAKPWFVQTNVVFVGQFAARSGIITHNQTSSLLLTGNYFAGNGSFDYRVSSELNFDTLKFLVDGVQQQQWSGDVPWANYLFPLTAGTHTLEWRYSKDASGTAGLDAAFLDNVNLPLLVGTNGASAATLQIQRQMDGTFFIDLTGQTNQLYVLQGSTNLYNWHNISTNIATSGFLRIADPASSSNQIQFYRAVAAPQ